MARRLIPALLNWLLISLLSLSAQTAGPLRGPVKSKTPETFVVGTVISFDGRIIRVDRGRNSVVTLYATASTDYVPGLPNLEAGAYVRIRAVRGPGGPLTALTIWDIDERAVRPERAVPRAARKRPETVDMADPGPPILKRRLPSESDGPERREPDELELAETRGSAPDFDFTPSEFTYEDPLLAKAITENSKFSLRQVNFVCRQVIDRSESKNLGKKWKDIDVIEAEVLNIDGTEHYQNIKHNGEESPGALKAWGGAWSKGEYVTMLRNLFLAGYAVEAERARIPDDDWLVRYDYIVPKRHSHWELSFESQKILTAYEGSFWVDPSNGRVTRIKMTAIDLPATYKMRTVETSLELETIDIEGESYLLPASAVANGCVRDSARCFWNDLTFSDYRKFEAESDIYQTESTIDFGGEAADQEAAGQEVNQQPPPEVP